ncbi:hypothetical protein EXIGLDRAFT_716515 [Exidia glandulosa HHB12029]|uniref:Uncharacterized protein n=1 Tax=Exidia glandulosa HHB12029 TaxID=1314781 RepID=A0A166BK84_EXIGL|nr:hypothetical protein EXIGLDRAFT_716515 [Exidia glandulosa HHB12029]
MSFLHSLASLAPATTSTWFGRYGALLGVERFSTQATNGGVELQSVAYGAQDAPITQPRALPTDAMDVDRDAARRANPPAWLAKQAAALFAPAAPRTTPMPARSKTPVNRQRPYTTDKAARSVKKAPPAVPVSRASAHGRVVLTIPPPLAPRPLVGLGFDTYSANTALQPAPNVDAVPSTFLRNDTQDGTMQVNERPQSSSHRAPLSDATNAPRPLQKEVIVLVESTTGEQVPVRVVLKAEGGTSVTLTDVPLVKHLVDDNPRPSRLSKILTQSGRIKVFGMDDCGMENFVVYFEDDEGRTRRFSNCSIPAMMVLRGHAALENVERWELGCIPPMVHLAARHVLPLSREEFDRLVLEGRKRRA